MAKVSNTFHDDEDNDIETSSRKACKVRKVSKVSAQEIQDAYFAGRTELELFLHNLPAGELKRAKSLVADLEKRYRK
jgi:hypothetical protein